MSGYQSSMLLSIVQLHAAQKQSLGTSSPSSSQTPTKASPVAMETSSPEGDTGGAEGGAPQGAAGDQLEAKVERWGKPSVNHFKFVKPTFHKCILFILQKS